MRPDLISMHNVVETGLLAKTLPFMSFNIHIHAYVARVGSFVNL
jgi:hypothetical protein